MRAQNTEDARLRLMLLLRGQSPATKPLQQSFLVETVVLRELHDNLFFRLGVIQSAFGNPAVCMYQFMSYKSQ
jgi:hypothetical protein